METLSPDVLAYAQKKIEVDKMLHELTYYQQRIEFIQGEIAARQAEMVALLEKING